MLNGFSSHLSVVLCKSLLSVFYYKNALQKTLLRIDEQAVGKEVAMQSDRAGSSIGRVRPIAVGSNERTVQGWLGQRNQEDFYTFRLNRASRVNVSLTGLESNANLSLLNSSNQVVRRSNRTGRQPEIIQGKLAAGTYYIRVNQGQGNTRYRLSTIARPTLPPATAIRPSSPPSAVPGSFDISFDYQWDTLGWFTPEKRAVLDSAAAFWENIIRDEFEAVPAGTMLNLTHPLTGLATQFAATTEIDDLRVYVGAKPMDGVGGMMAIAGPAGVWTANSTLAQRYEGQKFQPWAGSLSIDSSENWFVDSTPSTANDIPLMANDLLSVVIHELGHVLGISTSRAFDNLTINGRFTGLHARAENGGNPIPMTSDGHIADGFRSSGTAPEALMDPSLITGTRKLPTRLDIALLADIGYTVVYS